MENDKKLSLFSRLKQGLKKTGGGILAGIFLGEERINEGFFEELEEAMIMADVGMSMSAKLLHALRDEISSQKIRVRTGAREALRQIIADKMRPETPMLDDGEKAVLLIVGVNGVGKTTSIGKLVAYYKNYGYKPIIAAADTFRAAAAEQLAVWAKRADVPIIKHGEGADPAAVVFDAIASFKARGYDIMLCDTAGRLHNKQHLLDELSKINRVRVIFYQTNSCI